VTGAVEVPAIKLMASCLASLDRLTHFPPQYQHHVRSASTQGSQKDALISPMAMIRSRASLYM